MSHQILIIDCSESHRKVVRHFIERIHKGVKLVEYDPCASGLPGGDYNWSSFRLLIIDNQLGDKDGLAFVKANRNQPGFPPFIFLSSLLNAGSSEATRMVIDAIKLGAENFLFKKDIQVGELNNSILSVLRAAGYDPGNTIPDMPIAETPTPPDKKAAAVKPKILQTMEDTVHEIELAMAVIHGHAEWPFSMTDILQGKATIGDFKVTSYLGKGDNTTTFKASRAKAGKPVIIKMVGQSLDRESGIFKQCIADLDKVVTWDHPNLVKILQQGFIGEHFIIVQEFLAGDKLSNVLSQSGAMAEKRAVKFFLQILSALSQLQRHNMSVGTISPRNILFRDRLTLALMNYGIVCRMHALNQVTGQTSLGADAAYVSPEKVKKLQTDARTDLYSAGVIFYEMLAGYPPFHKGSAQDILYQHATSPVPELPIKGHPMNRVIQGLMMKTPSQRFQTADEVIKIVEKTYGKSS